MRLFAAHEVLGPITGTVIDDPKYESDYCMEIGEHSALEPGPPFRYVNHSCHPNCALVEVESDQVDGTDDDRQLWLETLSEIGPGEQITIDYAWPAWAAIPCHCGSPECRGWIVAAEQRQCIGRNRGVGNSPQGR